MEETFNAYQTVWHKSKEGAQCGPLFVRAIDVKDAWVRDADGDSYTIPLCDLTSVDPNKPVEPDMQNCPVCGGKAMMAGEECIGMCRVFCLTKGCILGQTCPTRIEAIRSWNSLHFNATFAGPEYDAVEAAAKEKTRRPKFKAGDQVFVVGTVVKVVGTVVKVDDSDLPYKVVVGAACDQCEPSWFRADSLREVP